MLPWEETPLWKLAVQAGATHAVGYFHEDVKDLPLTEFGVVPEERLWENFAYFLRRVVPAAEKAKVKLALHPDDPPLSPLGGIGRLLAIG